MPDTLRQRRSWADWLAVSGQPAAPASTEHRLAVRVVETAISDFLCRPLDGEADDRNQPLSTAMLERAIEAGEFLLERTDRCAVFWLTAAGLALDSRSRFDPALSHRLAQLRSVLRSRRWKAQVGAWHARMQLERQGGSGHHGGGRYAQVRR